MLLVYQAPRSYQVWWDGPAIQAFGRWGHMGHVSGHLSHTNNHTCPTGPQTSPPSALIWNILCLISISSSVPQNEGDTSEWPRTTRVSPPSSPLFPPTGNGVHAQPCILSGEDSQLGACKGPVAGTRLCLQSPQRLWWVSEG